MTREGRTRLRSITGRLFSLTLEPLAANASGLTTSAVQFCIKFGFSTSH